MGGTWTIPRRAEPGHAPRRIALAYYRKAVRLRPAWPYTWIDLALIKYRLGEMDAEFYTAWHRGMELGPWEPGVQKIAAGIGLHGWSELKKDDRDFTLEIIRKGASPDMPWRCWNRFGHMGC